ncbi:hypothetical protein KUTeg_005911 [Tegillarca granosa]|uniref:Uncharacterized protein n=1 Tax=Tegillarca granosa TaxID=220873 RepID=A0ABQ9FGW1_TEGGR|nr:hypothetical protein KUTeg_005911 [Tegillarca granosa]
MFVMSVFYEWRNGVELTFPVIILALITKHSTWYDQPIVSGLKHANVSGLKHAQHFGIKWVTGLYSILCS